MHSEFVLFLLLFYCRYEASLPFIVQIVGFALVEPLNQDDPRHIASLGANGANTNPMKRKFFQRLVSFVIEVASVSIRLPAQLLGEITWINFKMISVRNSMHVPLILLIHSYHYLIVM